MSFGRAGDCAGPCRPPPVPPMRLLASLAAVVAIVAAARADARACSVAAPTPHVIDPSMAATDIVPPTLPQPTVTVSREEGGRMRKPQHLRRHRQHPDRGGRRRRRHAGRAHRLPARRWRASDRQRSRAAAGTDVPTDALDPVAGEVVLVWDDIADGETEDFSFVVRVVAVDLAGNESEPRVLPIPRTAVAATAPLEAETDGRAYPPSWGLSRSRSPPFDDGAAGSEGGGKGRPTSAAGVASAGDGRAHPKAPTPTDKKNKRRFRLIRSLPLTAPGLDFSGLRAPLPG